MYKHLLISIYTLFSFNVFSQIQQITSFGSNPGNLKMYVYVPSNLNAEASVVVAMHGCTQTASDYVTNAGWNDLADECNSIIIYPEQQYLNNYNYCFNWFLNGDQTRDNGEAFSIKQMIDYVKANYTIDSSKIFVTGLSAGAAMTSVMAACYPEIFAGGAIMAGTPYKSGTDATTAYYAMSGTVNKTPTEWKALITGQNPTYTGSYPKMAIFHGLLDYTVSPNNITELTEQWTAIHNSDATADITNSSFNGISDIEQLIYYNSINDTVVMTYKISNMGHAVAVDPGSCLFQGGSTGLYSIDKDFHSTYWAARFFGLINYNKISGLSVIYSSQNNITYSVSNTSGSTYNWSVPSDVQIVSGQGTNQITVNWGSQNGNVSVTETNSASCVFPTEKLNVTITTSSELINNNFEISIYPNPASTHIQIAPYKNYKVKITDINSRVVFEGKPINGNINIKGFGSGIYFVEIFNNISLFREKLIIE
ncbi:MAG: hypothetical protein A2046_00615 [Bacteroidetes bacterium GWA2_30_7]|nr:MAG: hypothetical protein A2046_00615 [Bacteroidetes bacterium GWA2_30_7]